MKLKVKDTVKFLGFVEDPIEGAEDLPIGALGECTKPAEGITDYSEFTFTYNDQSGKQVVLKDVQLAREEFTYIGRNGATPDDVPSRIGEISGKVAEPIEIIEEVVDVDDDIDPLQGMTWQEIAVLADGDNEDLAIEAQAYIARDAEVKGVDVEPFATWVAAAEHVYNPPKVVVEKPGLLPKKAPKAKEKLKEAHKSALEMRPKTTAELRAVVEESGDLLSAAKSLSGQLHACYFTLGGVLARIKVSAVYETLTDEKGETKYEGNAGFHAYVLEELGIKGRKADYLISIFNACTTAGVNEKHLEDIGWTKVKELVPLFQRGLDEESTSEWLQHAKKKTVTAEKLKADVAEATQEIKGRVTKELIDGALFTAPTATVTPSKEPSTQVEVVKFSGFTCFEDNAKIVQLAIDKAKNVLGTDHFGAAIHHICSEWLTYRD